MALEPPCLTIVKVSHPSVLLLAALSVEPPPLAAWKYWPLPARTNTLSPLASEPPLTSTRVKVSHACATVAWAITAPPPSFWAPTNRFRSVVRKWTLLTVVGCVGGGGGDGAAESPPIVSSSQGPSDAP